MGCGVHPTSRAVRKAALIYGILTAFVHRREPDGGEVAGGDALEGFDADEHLAGACREIQRAGLRVLVLIPTAGGGNG